MLFLRLVPGDEAAARGNLKDARCEFCAFPYPDPRTGEWVQDLVQSDIVLEQVRDPKLACNVFIGACARHYPPELQEAYKEHGWKVRWRR